MNFWFGGNLEGDWTFLAEPWKIGLSVLMSIAALFLLWVLRGKKNQFRTVEIILWGLALLGIIFSISEPQVVSEGEKEELGRFVAIVDSSASMSIRENGVFRYAEADKILSSLEQDIEGPLDIYSFDAELSVGKSTDYQGKGTDIAAALSTIHDRYLGQDLQGIAVISDGIDRGVLSKALEGVKKEPLERILPKLASPFNFYQIASTTTLYDSSIIDVSSGGFAYLRSEFQLKASVQGQPNAKIQVGLYQDDSLVRTRRTKQQFEVQLDEKGRGTVEFSVIPTKVGRFSWDVRIPVDPQDAAPQNNRYPVVVKIVRDTIRVLQVCGSPSYDQKFLRLFLKQDPSVDLVSFFILRTNEDMDAGWSSDELSLIAFPYIQLFSEELQSFDLVLFQNFNYGPYFMSDANYLLGNIADFVLEGKAFVMTGGDRSFDLGEYVNTPIAEILPVQLGVSGSVSSEEQFLPRLTKGGAQHPITKLSSNPTDNQRIWSDLSKMDGFNRNNGLVPGAASLLAHPTEKTTSGAAMPILAVREVGKGRVMSLNVDSSWRWSFSEAVEGSGNQAYLRFWKNSLQWLVGDPEDRRVVISPERENAQIGEEMDIVFRSRDSSYRPIAKAKIKGHIRTPKGEKIKFEHVTGELGEVAMGYTPEEQGTYYIKANYKGDVAETVFAATARDPELLDLHPKKEWMKRLVEYYDGQYSTSYQAPLIDSKALRMIPERNRVKLGYAPAVGLWVALFSALAMWFRRRGGRP